MQQLDRGIFKRFLIIRLLSITIKFEHFNLAFMGILKLTSIFHQEKKKSKTDKI